MALRPQHCSHLELFDVLLALDRTLHLFLPAPLPPRCSVSGSFLLMLSGGGELCSRVFACWLRVLLFLLLASLHLGRSMDAGFKDF